MHYIGYTSHQTGPTALPVFISYIILVAGPLGENEDKEKEGAKGNQLEHVFSFVDALITFSKVRGENAGKTCD